jgi:hypothetical protein
MNSKLKVGYILNNAPNYRDVFLKELAKYVQLTVISFNGSKINLKDPQEREGYDYIELAYKTFGGISFQLKEWFSMKGDYDVLILGFDLRHPFRLLNVFRSKRIIFSGLIYGKKSNSSINKFLRKQLLSRAEGVLVYSDIVKEKLMKEISVPIISFNNTSFKENDIESLPFKFIGCELNLIWVGRYKSIKKIESLIQIARKYKNVNLRLIGPNIEDNIHLENDDLNIQIIPEVYDSELKEHFAWSHAVFSPGHIGLLVMNSARFGRPVFIGSTVRHAPEIALAKASNQTFLNFQNENEVEFIINECVNQRNFLLEKGLLLSNTMKSKYTVEYMTQQYLEAIKGTWNG